MSEHDLRPTPATTHWGFFDAAMPPVMTVAPGDVVTIGSVSGSVDEMPPPETGFTIRPEHREIVGAVRRGPGPHILTGPIAVSGAEPGDALRVAILDVALADDWGFNIVKPLAGALPETIRETRCVHLGIDRERAIVRTPWGFDVPARPFFGVMGTAPPSVWGRQTSVVPRAFGGNLDNTLLVAGTVLWLPVFVPGALLSVGDGHAVQGDGEVCLTAVETGLIGRLRLDLVKSACLARPRAETPTHHVTMGFDEDLDTAARIALTEMIELIVRCSALSFEDAYRVCSLVVDLRVTQLVNQHKGVHAMLPKSIGLMPATI